MAEYIKRDAFLNDIKERYCLPCEGAGKDYNGCKCRACWVDDMCDEVIDAPAADVAPVVHGRWECVYDDSMVRLIQLVPIAKTLEPSTDVLFQPMESHAILKMIIVPTAVQK